MPIQQWSEGIVVVDLSDEPQFTEDLQALVDRIDTKGPIGVVLNLGGLNHISSTHIGALLRIRKKLLDRKKKMRLCCMPDEIWGMFLVTGMDKVFDFSPD